MDHLQWCSWRKNECFETWLACWQAGGWCLRQSLFCRKIRSISPLPFCAPHPFPIDRRAFTPRLSKTLENAYVSYNHYQSSCGSFRMSPIMCSLSFQPFMFQPTEGQSVVAHPHPHQPPARHFRLSDHGHDQHQEKEEAILTVSGPVSVVPVALLGMRMQLLYLSLYMYGRNCY